MKKFLLSATALIALTTAASAADLPSRYAPAPAFGAVPVFTWSGFYVGAQVGYAWGGDETRIFNGAFDVTPMLSVGGTDYDVDGFLGGVHGGYNYQLGSFVGGVEGDLEAAGIDGNRQWGVIGDYDAAKTEVNFQGSLRARLGFAFDRMLAYGTAGLAFANIENTYTTVTGAASTVRKFDDTQWGWTLGAGVEYALTNNVTARAEYRYTQFDNYRHGFDGRSVQQEPDFHTLRMGVSYKFGAY
jgi:outer membrane immunogenic protein